MVSIIQQTHFMALGTTSSRFAWSANGAVHCFHRSQAVATLLWRIAEQREAIPKRNSRLSRAFHWWCSKTCRVVQLLLMMVAA